MNKKTTTDNTMLGLFNDRKEKQTQLLREILATLREINARLCEETMTGHTGKGKNKKGHTGENDRKKILSELNAFLSSRGIDIQRLSADTGLTPDNLGNILSGKHNMTKKVAKRLSAPYGINAGYLLDGTGSLTGKEGRPAENKRRGGKDEREEERIERHYLSRFPD